MQKRILKRLAVMALCSIVPATVNALTQYAMRPQTSNTAREISGVEHFIFPYRPDECDRYDVMWVNYAYDRSRKSEEISRCLFGNALDLNLSCADNQNILVQGSGVSNRSSRAWLADYFGLPTDFSSKIEVSPSITNNIVEFNYFSDLSQWCEGLWFRAHMPVVHTKWQLNFNETVVAPGTNGYVAGYFTDGAVPRHALLNSFLEYASGKAPRLSSGLTFEPGDVTTSERLVTYEPLACSKWANECCDLPDETKLSDIYVMLGYDLWENECGHLGLGVLASLPTGNRPDGEYFFEPIVGTGHHWGLGVVVNGSRNFWEAECSDRALDFFFELQVLHLFKDKQCAVFDLVNGCNSRYMLASRFRTDAEDLFYTENAASIENRTQMMRQFNYVYTPVANLSKTKLNVSYGAMYDFTALLSYTSECGNMYWDIGYNLWGRSCTKFSKLNDCDSACSSRLRNESWALKGDATMFGYDNFNIVATAVCGESVCDNGDVVVNSAIVALSATESCADITKGTNNPPNGINNVPSRANPGIDSPAFAIGIANEGFELLYDRPDSLENQVRTSSNPQLLSVDSLDVCAARQKGLSNTVFGNVTYTWDECGCAEPFVNFGARVEFGSNRDDCKDLCNQNKACTTTTTTCQTTSCDSNNNNSCVKCSLSQWGIWLRGGVVFG